VIIISYADFHENEISAHQPKIIVVDQHNAPRA
jgi:aspartate 1-decarboxylase